jgi:hypothetical protein
MDSSKPNSTTASSTGTAPRDLTSTGRNPQPDSEGPEAPARAASLANSKRDHPNVAFKVVGLTANLAPLPMAQNHNGDTSAPQLNYSATPSATALSPAVRFKLRFSCPRANGRRSAPSRLGVYTSHVFDKLHTSSKRQRVDSELLSVDLRLTPIGRGLYSGHGSSRHMLLLIRPVGDSGFLHFFTGSCWQCATSRH